MADTAYQRSERCYTAENQTEASYRIIYPTGEQSLFQSKPIIEPTCMICHKGDETAEHFILSCDALAEVRKPMLDRLMVLAKDLIQTQIDSDTLMQLILDSSKVVVSLLAY